MDNYEYDLFRTANKMRGKIPPSEYKFYVLPLVYLRYLSEKQNNNVWHGIVSNCRNSDISKILDEELSKTLPQPKGIKAPFSDMYGNSNLTADTIKDLILLINEIDLDSREERTDYLGKIYEYFISNFAAAEGNRGGEYYTPPTVVELLVRMLDPHEGTVFDPACGTGGIFIQSEKYNGKNIKFAGQEQNRKTVMLAHMNGALHGLDLQIKNGDTLLNDMYPDLKADYVISNPPFNQKDWGAEQLAQNDPRLFCPVNKNNANYMWIQHFIYHLKENGKAGFVISNGALTSSNESDYKTRKAITEKNLIDCVVQLPEKMFFGTAVPSALIFLDMDRGDKETVLFIDAGSLGKSISKTQNILTQDDIEKIRGIYHAYRSNKKIRYNQKGFSWIITKSELLKNNCRLMPSLYTGVKETVLDKEENDLRISELKKQLVEQIGISNLLANSIIKDFS